MAIKIYLEKVYNRLEWSFVIDSLKDMSLNDHFHLLLSSHDILWNSECTNDFQPRRGICQGNRLYLSSVLRGYLTLSR